jgi:hypothetical protein
MGKIPRLLDTGKHFVFLRPLNFPWFQLEGEDQGEAPLWKETTFVFHYYLSH